MANLFFIYECLVPLKNTSRLLVVSEEFQEIFACPPKHNFITKNSRKKLNSYTQVDSFSIEKKIKS